MIELRDMTLISALARHRHFARAAAECGISQPAFSMRIRKMELDMNIAIVRRGNRFQGFTEEGEIVLRWARKILEDSKALDQEIHSAKGSVSGKLTIGSVPTALAWAARIPGLINAVHPGISVSIYSATSLQIQLGVEERTMDAGITYGDGVSRDLMDVSPLYEESYVLLAPKSLVPGIEGSATWAQAAQVPLSLLVPEMQNRRILNRVFSDVGLSPRVVSEANVFSSALVQVNQGFAATIVPDVLAEGMVHDENTVALPLVDPVVSKSICLVAAVRNPVLPTVGALKRAIGVDP